MVKVMFNGQQGSVKRYKTLNYEGTQSRVLPGIFNNLHVVEGVQIGQDYYDNYAKRGWYIHDISTDMQDGAVAQFINKENKWFNYIRGKANTNGQVFMDAGYGDFLDSGEFSLQGLGYPAIESYNCDSLNGCTDPGDGLGAHTTLGECQAACQQRWLCSEGACTELFVNPSLGFPTEQECIDGVSSCGCYPCDQSCHEPLCISMLADGTVWYSSTVDVWRIQFSLPFDPGGGSLVGAYTAGDDAVYGLNTSITGWGSQHTVTVQGNPNHQILPAGCGVLMTLNWDSNACEFGTTWANYRNPNANNVNHDYEAEIGTCDVSFDTGWPDCPDPLVLSCDTCDNESGVDFAAASGSYFGAGACCNDVWYNTTGANAAWYGGAATCADILSMTGAGQPFEGWDCDGCSCPGDI